MFHSPANSILHRLRASTLGGGLLLAALAPLATEAAAPTSQLPLIRRITSVLFLTGDPGYLPLVGPTPLRFGEAAKSVPIKTPPIVLYSPPEPEPESTEPVAAEPAADVAPAETPAPEPATPERKPHPLQAADFLPYFQLNDGTSRGAPGEGIIFTPARSELPTSQAEFRQQ